MQGYKIERVENFSGADLQKGVVLDIRTRGEYAEKRLKAPHVFIPMDELKADAFVKQHCPDPSMPVFVLCRSGGRARVVADKLAQAGHPNTVVLDGGILSCEACGHDVVCNDPSNTNEKIAMCRTAMSIERQVRIVAGGLVFTGALLAILVNPLFALLPLCVGAGLVFAGVTDSCAMGLLLLKAPWNK